MKNDDKINICLACDDNYIKYAGVVIASVLANANPDDSLAFYILDGGVQDEHKAQVQELKSIKDCEINFVPIDESLFEDYKKVKTHEYITLATYYRLKLPSLLPNVKRVIYFDCDFVVNSSLSGLFHRNIGDSAVAGVLDIDKRKVKKNPTYVNAGMLIFDIEKMKEQNLEQKFLDWTREHIDTIKTGDQEIINEVLNGKISILPNSWNVQSSNFTNRSSYTNNPNAIHYVAKKKPWHWASFSYHRDLYFKYLQLTPWKMDEKELKHWTKDNQIASLVQYVQYRPLFMLRPRFYKAFYSTYLKDFCEKIFSVKNYRGTHKIVSILGIKIKFPKLEYSKKKKENPYYYYVKNNIDITTIPPATGQIRDIQLANLALLKELDYVCKQAGLKYWLDFGTVLGAIRHKGFIPWDDDIDTGMMREDYDKIIEAFQKFSRNSDIYARYKKSPTDSGHYYIKIQHKKCPHLFVDIFPYDFYGKVLTEEEQLVKSEEIREFRKSFSAKIKPIINENEIKEIFQKAEDKILNKDSNIEHSDLVWGLDFRHGWKNWFSSYDTVFPLKEISFEGEMFPCMNNPDKFLKGVYGNYMGYPKKIGYGHSMFLKLDEEEKDVIDNLIKGLK